jgi:hypothetical protein
MMCDGYKVTLEVSEADMLFTRMVKDQLTFIQEQIDAIDRNGDAEIEFPIYSCDPAEEKAELEIDKAAFVRVLEFYGVRTDE